MIMHNAESGDQFGVNFNWDYILLQIKEITETYEETRIKLTLGDVDSLIRLLQQYRERLKSWKEAVGAKRLEQTDIEYEELKYKTLIENKYFISDPIKYYPSSRFQISYNAMQI